MPHFATPASAWSRRAGGTSTRTTRCSRRFSRSCSTAISCSSTAARNRGGRFFNFNGTAGIWRRTAIADAGGWQHDTLTEDLDLSYRAQLRGWRFVFLSGRDRPGGTAGRDERVQIAAASLGQGIGPDLPQAAAAHSSRRSAARGEGRGVLPPDRELQLHPDVHSVGADLPVDGRSATTWAGTRCC